MSSSLVLSPLVNEILVGSLLGDAWLEKPKVNARLRFEQSNSRKEFFFYFYEYFAPYCQSSPKLRKRFDKRTNKIYLTWHFSTKCYPVFTNVYHLFYIDKKKVIPANIMDLMGPIALAFLIMSDAWRHNKGVTIATNSFSVAENELLIKVLNEKFALNSRLIYDHKYPSIHIPYRDLPKLQNLIVPYMHNTLLYKIYL